MRSFFIRYLLTAALAIAGTGVMAQGYQGLNGSPFTGSTAVFNNPAASIGSAYKWDLTIFSTQVKLSTDALYLKSPDPVTGAGTGLKLRDGYGTRFLHNNFDASLMNFLYKIDNSHAINFNIRARTYNHVKMLPFNYVDSTVTSINSFLIANRNTPFLEGFATHAGWLEADLNYSQLLSQTENSRLTGGVTLQIMKGVSAAFVKASKISYLEQKNGTDTGYTFTNGRGSFGYSDTYDNVASLKELMQQSITTFGLSLGIEYMLYNGDTGEGSENNNLNYDWKIGVSLMDLGTHSFKASQNSKQYSDPNTTVSDAQLNAKLAGAQDIQGVSDSLATLFNGSSVIDNFTISNPTRLVVNVDKNLGGHFYVNGELCMNFYSTSSYNKLHTRELNLLTITPRWETMGFGVYLPMQYNTQGQFWLGAAIKLGPLVLGVHNFGLLKKDPGLNGGGYMLLSFHPFDKKKVISKLDCL